MKKPTHAKPSLYAFYYEVLKEIAFKYGYNLVLNGSMNRDLDLIAIPWQEKVEPHEPMIKEMADCLGGYVMGEKGGQTKENFDAFKNKFHGRESWIININRGISAKYDGMVVEFKEHEDPQYYIDISVLPIESKWIDVKDFLPELGDEYNVVYDLEDGEPPLTTTMEFDAINKKWLDVIGAGIDKTDVILFWKPLPKPPTK